MEKRTKIIIGVVVAILVILVAGFLFLSNANVTLQGNEAAVTLPGNYTLDDKGIATAGNTSVMFTGIMSGSGGSEANFYKAVSQNGKEAGYKIYPNLI